MQVGFELLPFNGSIDLIIFALSSKYGPEGIPEDILQKFNKTLLCLQTLLETIADEVEALSVQLFEFEGFGDPNDVLRYSSQLQVVREAVEEITGKIDHVNKEEALLSFKNSSFPELTRIEEYLKPFSALYQTVTEWKAVENT